MRKFLVLAMLLVGLAVPVTAYAADLLPQQENQFTCANGGTWHFVNVQTGGNYSGTGDITAHFTGGDVTQSPNGAGVLKNTTHYWLTATGTLTGAVTSNNGFIVLSNFSCNEKKGK
jgi:hypothetical protein